MLHGTGARLTARLALVLSIAAGVMYIWTLGSAATAVLLPS
ncbi:MULTISPECIES: hypothetical protein [unclassified Microbacterium]